MDEGLLGDPHLRDGRLELGETGAEILQQIPDEENGSLPEGEADEVILIYLLIYLR